MFYLLYGPFCTPACGFHMKNEQGLLRILCSHFWQRCEINDSLRHVSKVTAILGGILTSNTYTMTQDIKVLLVNDTELYGRPAQLGK
jgi:hypothetical protein